MVNPKIAPSVPVLATPKIDVIFLLFIEAFIL